MSDTTKPGVTEGEWIPNYVEFHSGDSYVMNEAGEIIAAEIHGNTCDQMRANLNLISASPNQNAALQRVAAALIHSSHSEKHVSEDDWNPDARIEIVLTIADARAVYAALTKAEGKVTG